MAAISPIGIHRGYRLLGKRPPLSASASKPGAAAVTASLLRLVLATILAGTLVLCSLAIERVTGNKKTAVLREHPKEEPVTGSSLLSTSKDTQAGWTINPNSR